MAESNPLTDKDITNFINKFGKAGARPSLYVVDIAKPDGVDGVEIASGADSPISYLCKNAQLPGSTIGEIPVSFLGRVVKLPGQRTYENLTLSFYNDEDFKIRHNMEKWMHQIQSFKKPFGNVVGIANSQGQTDGHSTTTITVSQLAKDGNTLRKYAFYYAFPTTVSAIDLGYDQAEAIEEFSVTFAYSYFDIPGKDATNKIVDS